MVSMLFSKLTTLLRSMFNSRAKTSYFLSMFFNLETTEKIVLSDVSVTFSRVKGINTATKYLQHSKINFRKFYKHNSIYFLNI